LPDDGADGRTETDLAGKRRNQLLDVARRPALDDPPFERIFDLEETVVFKETDEGGKREIIDALRIGGPQR
jgi:hypothetical protein